MSGSAESMSVRLFRGYIYRDDRMYVMRVTGKFTKESDGAIVTDVKPEQSIDGEKPVVLLTYRNLPNLPSVRVDEFSSANSAFDYIKKIEPACPRISLGGQSPEPTPTWEEHLEWLHRQGLRSAAEGDAPIPEWIERESRTR